jgi:aldehyde dehydrogenase (NAD+)
MEPATMTAQTDETQTDRLALSSFLAGGPKRLYIDGKWTDATSGATFESINPSTGKPIARLADGSAVDVDRAVEAARRAFEGPWKSFKPNQRQNALLKLADLLAANTEELHYLQSVDMGSPITATPGAGLMMAADFLRYYAGAATKIQGATIPNSAAGDIFSYTLHEPVGVVASIIPWNGPVHSAVWKIAPVLATGCTMILKPAEPGSLSIVRLAELVDEVGLPPGVFNLLTGAGPDTGVALCAHPGVDKVAFTGSTATGQAIIRASAGNLKRLNLELGGKSANIIFADADLAKAVPAAAMAVFHNTGQSCCAGTRLFVDRTIYQDVVDQLAGVAKSLKVGDSLDPSTQIGPLVSDQQLQKVLHYFEAGERDGARTVFGGRRLTDGVLSDGYFVPPTILADVRDDMRVVREEIFGPVASVLPFDTVDEVIARANDSEFGLAGGIWTKDLSRAHKVAHSIRTGAMWVNTYLQFDPAVPFGGYKMSGWGREFGIQSLDEYVNTKAIWVNLE